MFPENLAEGETQMRGCEWSPAVDGGWRVGLAGDRDFDGATGNFGCACGGGGDLEFWTRGHGSPFPGVPSCLSRVQPRSPGRRLYLVWAPSSPGHSQGGSPGWTGQLGCLYNMGCEVPLCTAPQCKIPRTRVEETRVSPGLCGTLWEGLPPQLCPALFRDHTCSATAECHPPPCQFLASIG